LSLNTPKFIRDLDALSVSSEEEPTRRPRSDDGDTTNSEKVDDNNGSDDNGNNGSGDDDSNDADSDDQFSDDAFD
jgi:hypothetical protein